MSDFFKGLLGLSAVLAVIGLVLSIIYGWIMNIINLIDGTYEATSTVIVGFFGIVIPFVGAVVHFVAG